MNFKYILIVCLSSEWCHLDFDFMYFAGADVICKFIHIDWNNAMQMVRIGYTTGEDSGTLMTECFRETSLVAAAL